MRRAGRGARMAMGLAALTLLCGCAGDSFVSSLLPPNPDVPQVAPDAYPTLGTTPTGRPPPMTPAERTKLQQELEDIAKKRQEEQSQPINPDG